MLLVVLALLGLAAVSAGQVEREGQTTEHSDDAAGCATSMADEKRNWEK